MQNDSLGSFQRENLITKIGRHWCFCENFLHIFSTAFNLEYDVREFIRKQIYLQQVI